MSGTHTYLHAFDFERPPCCYAKQNIRLCLVGSTSSVLPRPFSEGGTPCPFLVMPCPFQKAEMTPCPFLVTPNDALLHFT